MTCPYCTEEIKETAIVCPHCHRDLTFFVPIRKELAALHARIDEIFQIVEGFRARSVESSQRMPSRDLETIPSSTMIGFAIVTAIGVNLINIYDLPIGGLMGKFWLVLLSPWVVGLALGYRFPLAGFRKVIFTVFIAIVSCGVLLLALLSLSLIVSSEDGIYRATGGPYIRWGNMSIDLLLNSAIAGFLVFTGSITGRWFGRKRQALSPHRTTQRLAARLLRGKTLTSQDSSKRVKLVAEIINALAPILSFIATIVTAYLTYLGAVHRK